MAAGTDPVAELLWNVRQHPGFQPMLDQFRAAQQPGVPRFKKSDAEEVEKVRSRWIYESGRLDMFEAIVAYLTGKGDKT